MKSVNVSLAILRFEVLHNNKPVEMLHPSKYEGESISIRPPLTTTFSISFFTISLFPKKAHPELSSHPQKKSYYQNDACKSELYAKRISTLMIAKLSTQEFDACNSTKLRKLK